MSNTPKQYNITKLKQNLDYETNLTRARSGWVKNLIDSGCSCTIFTERWMFQDFVEYVAAIKTAGGTIYSEGRGTVGKLQNCLYVPSMDVNLISSGHAVEHIPNLEIAQRAGLCIIRNLQNRNADKVF